VHVKVELQTIVTSQSGREQVRAVTTLAWK